MLDRKDGLLLWLIRSYYELGLDCIFGLRPHPFPFPSYLHEKTLALGFEIRRSSEPRTQYIKVKLFHSGV